jgi:hypothetical protein
MTVDQWELFGPEPEVHSGVSHGLRNRTLDQSLRYGERSNGINLVWDRSSVLRNISLETATPGAPIRFGEPVSLLVDGGGHLDYASRDVGINLTWSATPTFQWAVGGGEPGTVVGTRQLVRLTNLEHGDYLVYGERDAGINLRWWADIGGYGSYPPLPMPERFRSPSGESGQVELRGLVDKISVFHGGTDDELDWHIYLRLDPGDRRELFDHLLAHGRGASDAHNVAGASLPLVESDLEVLGCEWMVLDGYDNSFWDELFYSADVTEVLRLDGTAWDHSADAGDEQNVSGASRVPSSALLGKPVLVQGPFVNDSAHGFTVEVHPLDSVAYPLTVDGAHVEATAGTPGWPTDTVTWRVAAFTNSSFHRINGAEYVQRERQTRWFLPLPSSFQRFGWGIRERLVGFTNEGRRHAGLDDRRPGDAERYDLYGVLSHSARTAVDPRDGLVKLQVDVTMAAPTDRWGSMFLADYTVAPRFGGHLGGGHVGGVIEVVVNP